jgi:hypothetical protein
LWRVFYRQPRRSRRRAWPRTQCADDGPCALTPIPPQAAQRLEIKGVGGEPEGAKPGSKNLYIQVVFTAMVEGKEREFNQFYDDHHAPELAAIPGFVSAQRMILARPSNASIRATKYLALFRVETSDLAAVKEIASSPGFTSSPAFDTRATRGYTFRAIGPVIEGDHVRAVRAQHNRDSR